MSGLKKYFYYLLIFSLTLVLSGCPNTISLWDYISCKSFILNACFDFEPELTKGSDKYSGEQICKTKIGDNLDINIISTKYDDGVVYVKTDDDDTKWCKLKRHKEDFVYRVSIKEETDSETKKYEVVNSENLSIELLEGEEEKICTYKMKDLDSDKARAKIRIKLLQTGEYKLMITATGDFVYNNENYTNGWISKIFTLIVTE